MARELKKFFVLVLRGGFGNTNYPKTLRFSRPKLGGLVDWNFMWEQIWLFPKCRRLDFKLGAALVFRFVWGLEFCPGAQEVFYFVILRPAREIERVEILPGNGGRSRFWLKFGFRTGSGFGYFRNAVDWISTRELKKFFVLVRRVVSTRGNYPKTLRFSRPVSGGLVDWNFMREQIWLFPKCRRLDFKLGALPIFRFVWGCKISLKTH